MGAAVSGLTSAQPLLRTPPPAPRRDQPSIAPIEARSPPPSDDRVIEDLMAAAAKKVPAKKVAAKKKPAPNKTAKKGILKKSTKKVKFVEPKTKPPKKKTKRSRKHAKLTVAQQLRAFKFEPLGGLSAANDDE